MGNVRMNDIRWKKKVYTKHTIEHWLKMFGTYGVCAIGFCVLSRVLARSFAWFVHSLTLNHLQAKAAATAPHRTVHTALLYLGARRFLIYISQSLI